MLSVKTHHNFTPNIRKILTLTYETTYFTMTGDTTNLRTITDNIESVRIQDHYVIQVRGFNKCFKWQ